MGPAKGMEGTNPCTTTHLMVHSLGRRLPASGSIAVRVACPTSRGLHTGDCQDNGIPPNFVISIATFAFVRMCSRKTVPCMSSGRNARA